jgi:hypothetical protein
MATARKSACKWPEPKNEREAQRLLKRMFDQPKHLRPSMTVLVESVHGLKYNFFWRWIKGAVVKTEMPEHHWRRAVELLREWRYLD